MDTTVARKEPVFDQGLCRCCGNMKKCRILNVEYFTLGQKEIYSDMIMDCFSLLLSHLDGVASERLICATCVSRVRDALDFKKQALKCEEAFLQMKIYDGVRRSFVDRGRFVMHQTRHEEGDFPCPTCGKVFKAQYNRDLHIDRVHKKRGRVYCPKCDVRLMSYMHKLKHLVEVHGQAPLSFPCDNFDRTFETRRNLTIHQRKEHLKDNRYECQCCGQKFFTRFALTNHMPRHTGERNYKCKVCEKTYPRLKTLKDHMRIHTNDRRYRCHVCAQAFIQNCSLKGHLKSQHPEYVFTND